MPPSPQAQSVIFFVTECVTPIASVVVYPGKIRGTCIQFFITINHNPLFLINPFMRIYSKANSLNQQLRWFSLFVCYFLRVYFFRLQSIQTGERY